MRNSIRLLPNELDFENLEIDQKPLLESHTIQEEIEEFANGPLPKTACTEKGFLIAYSFVLLMSFYFVYDGLVSGDSNFLNLIGDAEGNSCGNSAPSHKFLYFPNLLSSSPLASAQRVCVAECPKFNYTEIAYLSNPEQAIFSDMDEEKEFLTYYNLESVEWEEEAFLEGLEIGYYGEEMGNEAPEQKIKESVFLEAITLRKWKSKGSIVYNETIVKKLNLTQFNSGHMTAIIPQNQPKYKLHLTHEALDKYRSNYKVNCVPTNYTRNCSQNTQNGFLVYDSNPFISICIPLSPTLTPFVAELTSYGYINKFLNDINRLKWTLYILSFGTWAFSIVFVMVCQLFPGFVLWSSSFGVVVILFVLGYLIGNVAMRRNPISLIVPDSYKSFLNYEEYLLAEISCYLLAVFALYMIIQYRRFLILSQELVKVATEFYRENKKIILIPAVIFLVQIGFLSIGLSTTILMYTSGTPKVHIEKSPYVFFSFSSDVPGFFGLMISASSMIWSISIAQAVGDYIIVASTCKWYFNKKALILSNSYDALRYHFGTLALYALMTFPFVFVIKIYELLMVSPTSLWIVKPIEKG